MAHQLARVICRTTEDFAQVLLTNVVGTFSVTNSFLPLLKAGHKKTIVHISSNAASLSRNHICIRQEGLTDASLALSYRASKVAVNMGQLSHCPQPSIQLSQNAPTRPVGVHM